MINYPPRALKWSVIIFLLLFIIGHDSKPSSSENLRLRQPSRKKESLNVPVAESSCIVSVDDVTPVEHHVTTVSSFTGERQMREPTTSSALLRPALTSSRKGHGHRHRRAMRRASSGVSCAVPLSLVEVDPREPQVVLSESALLSAHRSGQCHHLAETIAMQTLNTSHATVASPAHSDLSSLSSYKETSPESESAAPPSSLHLLKLNASCPFKINLSEARRRSDNRLSSLSHSRDSLEMYKNRTQRKLSVDGMVLSESAIVHAVAEPASSVSNSSNVATADSMDHMLQTEIAHASQQSSDTEYMATADDPVQPDNEAGNISTGELSLSSIVPEVTNCDDVTDQACGGCSPTECKSESSNTLTPATDTSSNTVRKRVGKNVKSRSATSSSRKLSSLFCGASTNGEVGDDVADPAAETNRTDLTTLDWLFSTDSEDSPSSGMQTHVYYIICACLHKFLLLLYNFV